MRPLLVGVLVTGAACGASHETTPPSDTPPTIDAPTPMGDTPDAGWSWQSLISNNWSMAMQSAGIRCSTLPITQEMWIDGFRPGADMNAQNDHQFLIVTSDSSCLGSRPLEAVDELLYGVGLGSNGQLELPAGTAVHVVPSTTSTPLYLMLYDHIANETASTITGTSSIEAHFVADPTTVAHEVDMVLGGQAAFSIPADDPSYAVNGPCQPAVTEPWHLVALWPHMHEAGMHATVSVAGTNVLDTAYSYLDEQTYVIPDTLVDINAVVDVGCTLMNANAFALNYGEIQPEMCATPPCSTVCWTGLYKYPTGTDPSTAMGVPHGPEACVKGL